MIKSFIVGLTESESLQMMYVHWECGVYQL